MNIKNQMQRLSPQSLGAMQVAIGAFITAFASLFVRLSEVSPTGSAVYRMLFGGIGLLVIALVRKETLWRDWKLFRIHLMCAVCIALDLYCFHKSIHYVGPGLATLLGNFQIFFLFLVAVLFYGEKISLRFMTAMLLSIFGLFLLVGLSWDTLSQVYRSGVYFGLAVGLFYAFATLTLRASQMHPHPTPACANLAIISLISVPMLGMIAWADNESLVIPTALDWVYMLGNGIAGQVLGWMIVSRGLPLISISLGGLLILFQPAGSFLMDIFILGRPTSLIDFVGLLVTLCALYLGFSNSSKVARKKSLPETDKDEQTSVAAV